MESKKDSLNRAELLGWVRNTLIFSSPALIAFLTAVQGGQTLSLAFGMLTQALLASGLDLLRKYSAGVKA